MLWQARAVGSAKDAIGRTRVTSQRGGTGFAGVVTSQTVLRGQIGEIAIVAKTGARVLFHREISLGCRVTFDTVLGSCQALLTLIGTTQAVWLVRPARTFAVL